MKKKNRIYNLLLISILGIAAYLRFANILKSKFYKLGSILTYILIGLFLMTKGFGTFEDDKRGKTVIKLALLWIFLPIFFYAFYHGTFPEYYYLINVFVALFALGSFLTKLVLSNNFIHRCMAFIYIIVFFVVSFHATCYIHNFLICH